MNSVLKGMGPRTANTIRHLLLTAQTLQNPLITKLSKPLKSYAPTSKASLPFHDLMQHTRYKAKEIAKPIIPPSVTSRKIYNLPTITTSDSSNIRNKNVDTTPRYKNDNQTGQFRNQRAVNVVEGRETVGGLVDDQNDVECDDERVALANLIANLKLDVDENKKIQKQLKKENATLTQELTECKSILAETSRTLGESNSIRDSCLVALQNKQTEFERTISSKKIDIKESLKVKAYEISVFKEKHDELVKQSLLTKSHYEGLVKEKTKVITDLKLKEEKDIDKMISMENQLKFLNEIVYKRSQSIQTIHMLAPKCPTFNGRPTFANPRYLKKAQNEIPCLYAIPHDQSDPANRLVPDREETLTLDNESRSKLNKDLVKPFDYTKLNILSSLVRLVQLILFIVDSGCTKHYDVPSISAVQFLVEKKPTSSNSNLSSSAESTQTPSMVMASRLSHLNFDYINLLSKKDVVIGLPKLKYFKDQLCSSCEMSKVKRSFIQVKDCSSSERRGTEFLNKTLNAFFKEEGIEHQTSTPRTPEQNALSKDETAPHSQMVKNLDKMKEKGDPCILVGYSTQSKGYRVYNKRTRLIVESIHLRFDEIKEMSETSVANDTLGPPFPNDKKRSD
ncbi:ribonuclease H-like domain-containing protein [Tanacetum coccineum]